MPGSFSLFQNNTSRVYIKSSDPFAGNQISQTDIKQAILGTTGPVATPKAVKAVKAKLNILTTKQFMEAAEELERMNLGKLMKFSAESRGKPTVLFIKKPPSDVEEILRMNPQWCSFDVYSARYAKGSSKAIGLQLRAKLVAMKLVSKNCFM